MFRPISLTWKVRFLILFYLIIGSSLQPPSAFATAAAEKSDKAVGVPTHHQTHKLEVNAAGRPKVNVTCFCLTADDRILAGCVGAKGEIRVLDTEGKLADSWVLPVKPEAIFAREDGAVFVTGDGQLLKLNSAGKVELTKDAPHAKALDENPAKFREEIVNEFKERAKQLSTQTEAYDKMIERADKELAKVDEQLSAMEKQSGDSDNKDSVDKSRSSTLAASQKRTLEQRHKMYAGQKEQYEQLKKQFAEAMGVKNNGELTDAEIDAQVKESKAYKLKASSISALDGDVFLATHATLGYGFEVWRMDDNFENAKKIVTDLSGCCGQMDCKANKDGLFVAENSKHRVCHFDRNGKSIGAFGESARSGLEGFGSCCNPMNVAFGPGNAVYTAEDDTGRVKRYSEDGKLLGLVGAVELKPGCKNCSISVSKDGSSVYMLDITRNFIIRMDARPAEEISADIKSGKSSVATETSTASTFLETLQSLLPSDN